MSQWAVLESGADERDAEMPEETTDAVKSPCSLCSCEDYQNPGTAGGKCKRESCQHPAARHS